MENKVDLAVKTKVSTENKTLLVISVLAATAVVGAFGMMGITSLNSLFDSSNTEAEQVLVQEEMPAYNFILKNLVNIIWFCPFNIWIIF